MIRKILAILLLTLGVDRAISAAYITDRLLVGLYTESSSSGKPIKILSSGTAIEILEREGVTIKVKLKDGTTGWVERRYVTEEMPAAAVVNESKERLAQLEEELKRLRQESEENPKAKELETKLGLANKQLEELQSGVKQKEESLAAKDKEIKTLTLKLQDVASQVSQKPATEDDASKQAVPQGPAVSSYDAKHYEAKIEQLEAQLLQAQIKLARRNNLKEDEVYKELDAVRERMLKAVEMLNLPADVLASKAKESVSATPGLPLWVYFMFLITLIAGIVAGFALFDLRTRSHHR